MAYRLVLAVLLLVSLLDAAVLEIAGVETGNVVEFSSSGGGAAASGTNVRTGDYCLDLPSGAFVTRTFTSSSEVRWRFYWRLSTAPSSQSPIANFRDVGGTKLAELFLNSDRTLSVLASGGSTANGSTAMTLNTYERIEFRYKAGSGANAEAEVLLEGVSEATDNTGTGTNNATTMNLEARVAEGAVAKADDLRIDSGTVWPGAGQIEAMRPNAVGDEDFWTNTFAEIDDDPLNDGTSRVAPGSGSTPFVNNLTTISSVGTINHVRIGARANRGNGGGREHYIRADNGGTPENSGDLVLGTGVAYYTFDPTTEVPSTQGELDSFQAGADQSAAGGRLMTVTELYVMVDYTPGAAPAAPKRLPLMGVGG
jgi:hypothetical protein